MPDLNHHQNLYPSAVRAATPTPVRLRNRHFRGLLLTWEVTGNAGPETVTLQVQLVNATTGNPQALAYMVAPPLTSNTKRIYGFGKGLDGTVNGLTDGNLILPFDALMTITHSAAGNWTYSLDAQWLL